MVCMNLLVKVKKKVSGFTEDSNSQTVKVKGNLPMREMNADVIIVAAGPAGLAAAVTVGEHNLSSIVFENQIQQVEQPIWEWDHLVLIQRFRDVDSIRLQ